MSSAAFRRRVEAAGSVVHTVAGARISLLTGQSRWSNSRLSPGQHAFLDAVATTGVEGVRSGFPYDAEDHPAEPATIAAASWRNGRQWLWTLTDGAYVGMAAAVLQRLIDSAPGGLVLVTGSQGLALLERAWPRLHVSSPPEIVALGPVGRRPPTPDLRVVQGARDGWSRAFYRGPVHHRPACGHLDYWSDPVARAVTADAVRRLLERRT